MPSGFKSEVLVGTEWCPNGVVWQDAESAAAAGADLLSRWFVPTAWRVVETDEEPNRPTWDGFVAENGLPPKSVRLG